MLTSKRGHILGQQSLVERQDSCIIQLLRRSDQILLPSIITSLK